MPTRANLRLSDLATTKPPSKLVNVKVPDTTQDAIFAMAGELGCSKTEAVVALLNEGLDAFEERRGEFPKAPAKVRGPRRGRPALAAPEAAVG